MRVRVRVARGVAYETALDWQLAAVEALKGDPEAPARLFLVEHTPVVTLGRSGGGEHLRLAPEALRSRGIAFHETRRGGDVTYHGPGQWTLYPVLPLKRLRPDLHHYMRQLEQTVLRYLVGHGLEGRRRKGKTGVWIGADKIAAVGVAVTHWIGYHGVAVNVKTDLRPFRAWMTPCGIPPEEGGVTSLAEAAGGAYAMDEEAARLLDAFFEVFPCEREDEPAPSA